MQAEAKTQRSKLVEAVLRGEEVVIANRGKPVVKMVKAEAPVKRQWGAWAGLITGAEIDHAFLPKVDAEIAREWLAAINRPIDAGLRPRARCWRAQSPSESTREGDTEAQVT